MRIPSIDLLEYLQVNFSFILPEELIFETEPEFSYREQFYQYIAEWE